MIPTCRELGVGIVAYSPLGRGLLSGAIKGSGDIKEGDWRSSQPRFSQENLDRNAQAAAKLAELAAKKGVTPGQLALAWLHAQGPDVFPIPGTKSPQRLRENAAATTISLSPAELAEISSAVPEGQGERYAGMWGTWNLRANL